MVHIKNLFKHYGKFIALNHLDLDIEKGEFFGFVGPNGAGKTTTMRIISGLLRSDGGIVTVDGIDAIHDNGKIKEMIGYMPDFFGVYDNLKAIEYMEFYASIYGIIGNEAKKLCMELMDLVNLADKADAYVDGLSRGMKQRLCLARCLVHNPSLLILDEPASGLDPRARFEMKGILGNLNDMGKTIIISSHILPELAEMCDTIGIIEHGKMLQKGTVEDIMSDINTSNPLVIKLSDGMDIAVRLLKENPLVDNLSIGEGRLSVKFDGDEIAQTELLRTMVREGVSIHSFAREEGNLESVFMKITQEEEDGHEA